MLYKTLIKDLRHVGMHAINNSLDSDSPFLTTPKFNNFVDNLKSAKLK